MAQYILQEEFELFKTDMNQKYEQCRKLQTSLAIAVEQKIDALSTEVNRVISKKPDPHLIKEFWIRQVPKIAEALKSLQMDIAKMKAVSSRSKQEDSNVK